jgi:hypothetical protein
MKKIIIILIILFAISSQAQATDVVTGVFLHDAANFFGCSKTEGGFDIGVEAIFGKGVIRPNAGFTINARGETSKAYAGLVLGTTRPGFFASFAVGGAVQVNNVRKLGSVLLFRLALEVGYTVEGHRVSIILDHISNADLADQNAGLDILGIRYGYKF